MRRNYQIALSYANLVYLRAWSFLLPVTGTDLYFRKTLPGISLYFGVAADVLALSLVTFLLITFAPKMPAWLRRTLPVLAIGVLLLALTSFIPDSFLFSSLFHLSPKLMAVAESVFCGVLAGLAFRFSSLTLQVARTLALAATPCLAVTFIGSPVYLAIQAPLPPDSPLATRLAGSPPVRVLWIVFDEWDERLFLPDRPQGTVLPVLDRLATHSFTATRARTVEAGIVPVPVMATADSLPFLIYGKKVRFWDPEDSATRRVEFDEGGSTTFGSGDTIFARLRSLGWNSALAGWHLPYCRVFASQLTDCYWDEMYGKTNSASPHFMEGAVDVTRLMFEGQSLPAFGPALVSVRHAAEYEAILTAARRYVADPSIGLAFIHFNIPHSPYFYNPKIGGPFTGGWRIQSRTHQDNSPARYGNALELVDRTVAEMLASLKSAGLDSKTAIILSSDHPARFTGTDSTYVPFFVHLPGELAGVISSREFSATETADLVMAIARGEVKSPFDVEAVLGIARQPK